MIPIKLTIEGIYSYQERQTIDFTELTSGGLFGILGGVGSGKSSILEAITFALYGQTTRLSSNDRRNYNMMNLKSDRIYVEFDFMNYENNKFRATREIKRNSKNFDVIRTPVVQFYYNNDGAWIPLEHSNAEEIIGLSYKNFIRTIIIPQGQFKEFLELGPTDRTNMMKEIFQLQRFDLQDKVTSLRSSAKSQHDQISGRLMEYEFVNQDDIDIKNEQFKQLDAQLTTVIKEHQLLDEKYQLWKGLKEDSTNLQKNKEQFAEMQKEVPTFESKQKQLQTYERLFSKFDKLIADYNRESKRLDGLNQDYELSLKEHNQLEQKLQLQKKELNEITPQYNALPQKRKEETDLKLIAQIADYRLQVNTLKQRLIKGDQVVREAKEVFNQIVNNIKQQEENVALLTTQRYDSKLLVDIEGWYNQHESNIRMIAQHQKTVSEREADLKLLLKEIQEKRVDADSFEVKYQNAVKELNERETNINQQRSNLELQQKLTDYTKSLHDGSACPLCGSTEHPSIANMEDVSQHLVKVADELNKISVERNNLQTSYYDAVHLFEKKKQIQTQLDSSRKDLNSAKEIFDNHKSVFAWKGFRPDDRSAFDDKKKQSFELETKINEANSLLSKLRKEESMQRQNVDKFEKLLEEIKNENNTLHIKIESNTSHIEVLNIDEYINYTADHISNLCLELKIQNDKTESDFTQLNNNIAELDKRAERRKAELDSLEKQKSETTKEIEILEKQINVQLVSEGYVNLNDVQVILAEKLDVEKIRNTIQQFNLEYSLIKDRINTLEEKLRAVSFDDTQFAKHEEEWKISKEKLDSYNNKVVELKVELDTLNKKYKEKQLLVAEHEKSDKRLENLNVMYNLFRGQGFVQYVSSIYLSQLCDHANERFRRMTRNQLRLQINENNEFEIVDYLNEGRTRSVKTLSGGQSFQVSLSLALALAESVQSNAKADRNFFFIDEGFGTQDLDSVNIVFETLLNLNKENKIVGIISHVEELKERIPMTLTVIKDGERGSLIS